MTRYVLPSERARIARSLDLDVEGCESQEQADVAIDAHVGAFRRELEREAVHEARERGEWRR